MTKRNPVINGKKCNKGHSTWLHEGDENESSKGLVVLHSTLTPQDILLATAVVSVINGEGAKVLLRALIDSGSQGSIVTKRTADKLSLPIRTTGRNITGLGGSDAGMAKRITLQLSARFRSEWTLEVECYVLKNLTNQLPDNDYNPKQWNHLKGLTWADPEFYKQGPIDLLIGMDILVEIMKSGLVKGPQGQPMAQETKIGWLISGKVDRKWHSNELMCLIGTNNPGDNDKNQPNLTKFWEIEDLQPERQATSEELECEKFYQETVKQDIDGKYIVKIPFNKEKGPERLGYSRNQSMARFLQLEKRFKADKNLKMEYSRVMNEYLQLGHMKEVTHLGPEHKKYFIPHHAVVKTTSLTTKLRVVFDASAKTSTGVSLNECMYVGGQQQQDLMTLLIRWRKHKIVFKADVEKMYRQVKLDSDDQKYHTILWRTEPNMPIKEFQLTTATFGTAAAPFMATRTLIQIAEDTRKTYPLAERIIKNDFYVDDLISGSDNLEQAILEKDAVMNSLKTGGMVLRKWTSNDVNLLKTIPHEQTEEALQMFEEDDTKTLGICWNPKTDVFSFEVKWIAEEEATTKRKLLSQASRLYDPLGWIAPVMIKAKMIMQAAYVTELGWDEQLPNSIISDWTCFKKQLSAIEKLRIPRWIHLRVGTENLMLCGFCDASEQGYAAEVFTRVGHGKNVKITMIASKTRVASRKSKMTLPQLELCGAVLLSNLMTKTKRAFQLDNAPTYAWTDSMITLGWINAGPERWKTFVANRVAEIMGNKIDVSGHVKSEENPSDCASRGMMPDELEMNHIWFTGPWWLKNNPETWTTTDVPEPTLEKRRVVVNVAIPEEDPLLERFSSIDKLVRVTAYCLRFKTQSKGILTARELEAAKQIVLKKVRHKRSNRNC